jgi:hypothetical protein
MWFILELLSATPGKNSLFIDCQTFLGIVLGILSPAEINSQIFGFKRGHFPTIFKYLKEYMRCN